MATYSKDFIVKNGLQVGGTTLRVGDIILKDMGDNTMNVYQSDGTTLAAVITPSNNVTYDNTASGLTATNVKAALDELKTSITNQDQANEISYSNTTSGLTAATVQAAIDEIIAEQDTNTKALLADLDGDIIPSADITYDLGSPTKQWRDLYIGPGSLYLNGTKVLEDNAGTLNFAADANQSMTLQTSGTGQTDITSAAGVNLSATGTGSDVSLTADGNIEINSNLLILAGKAINTSDGNAVVFSVDADFGVNSITAATVTANLTGNVTGTVSTLSNHNTADLAEGTNQYFTTARARASISASGDLNYNSTTGVVSFTERTDSEVQGLISVTDAGGFGAISKSGGTITYTGISTEEIQDVVGGMVSTNTENGVVVTYDDTNGKLNFDVNDPTITLSGDVSGSATMTNLGNTTISVTVADDSHNHTIANVDGLQVALNTEASTRASADTALDSRLDVLEGLSNVEGSVAKAEADAKAYTDTRETAITTAYQSADATLQSNINTEKGRVDAILSASSADKDTFAEIVSFINSVDTTNDTALGTEITTRASADTTLQSNIDAEAAARIAADNTLQSNINTKLAASHDMTLTLSGDASGSATFTNMGNATLSVAVADDSHNHVTSNIDGLAEYISDTVGAMVSSNTESGISVTYDDTDNTLDFNVNDPTITLTGAVTGSATMTNLGNVSIATTATADPTLTINGDASGSATFTNLGNATLTLTIADDSHNHTISNVDGLQAALDAKQAAGTYNTIIGTDSDINTSGSTIIDYITVTDGVITAMGTRTLSASDIGALGSTAKAADSDLLDGLNSTQFLRSDTTDVQTSGAIRFNDNIELYIGTSNDVEHFWNGSNYYTDINGGANWYLRDGNSSNATRFTFDIDTGTLTCTDVNVTSDERLKENVETISDASSKVTALRGVNFNWKESGAKTMGVIAQEVEEVIPEVVATNAEGMKSVNYQAMVGLLIEAVKNLQAQIDDLKNNK